MKLSSMAKLILLDPMKFLDLDHGQKNPVDAKHIWTVKHEQDSAVSEGLFVDALKSIRKFASQRGGRCEEKALIHRSIIEYSDLVWSRFGSVNQLNYHLKGLYGCELPKVFRDHMRHLFSNAPQDTIEEDPIEEVLEDQPNISQISLCGVSFNLTTGSSLIIGELATKSLNLKGMRSINIDKVSEGRLFGVSLKA